jgi:hypothetical protein
MTRLAPLTPLQRLVRQTGLSDEELADYLTFKISRPITVETLTRAAGHRGSLPPEDIILEVSELILRQQKLRDVAYEACRKGCKSSTEFKLLILDMFSELPNSAELDPAIAVVDLATDDITRTLPPPVKDPIPQQYTVIYVPLGQHKATRLSYRSEDAAWTGAKAHICEANPHEPIVIHRERWLKSENGWKVVQVTHPIKAGDLEPRWLPYGILEAPKISERV